MPAPDGVISARDARAALLVGRPLSALTSMICFENTHNAAGGRVVPMESINELCAFARAHELKIHVDGARLFNAVVASGHTAAELVAEVDSVTFCLTKGLGCPTGSLVAGDADFIEEARHKRQLVGGGMRQAGVWAAAGLVALTTVIPRSKRWSKRRPRSLGKRRHCWSSVAPWGTWCRSWRRPHRVSPLFWATTPIS